MKLVRESIQNFKRGIGAKEGLEIGARALIKQWFEEFVPDAYYKIDEYFNIRVYGDLYLNHIANLSSLPDNLKVNGYLYLTNTNITYLPDNLSVGGSLVLEDTKITSLPDNLSVGKNLNLRNTNITSLPDNLKVGWDLDLRGTNITSLPGNLRVGERIHKDF